MSATEKACTRCGEVKPLEGFYKKKDGRLGRHASCKECHRAEMREYCRRKRSTPEGMQAHREANRDISRELKRKQRADPEGLERARAAQRRWASRQPREYWLAHAQRRRALGRAGGSYSAADWRRLVNRFQGRCAYCHERPDVLHVEHVVPLSRGGTNTIGNLLPACRRCNLSKGARLLVEWRAARKREVENVA